MKKLIFALLLIGTAVSTNAQLAKHYINTSGTLTGDGFVYKYNKPFGLITLYNANNRFTNVEWAMKDSSVMPSAVRMGEADTFEEDNWTRQKAFSIVNNAFTASEKELVKGKIFGVEMKIDSFTGKISDIEFVFVEDSNFQQIPPETFYKIEKNLKSGIWFTPTAAGKKLNYIILGWNHKVE